LPSQDEQYDLENVKRLKKGSKKGQKRVENDYTLSERNYGEKAELRGKRLFLTRKRAYLNILTKNLQEETSDTFGNEPENDRAMS